MEEVGATASSENESERKKTIKKLRQTAFMPFAERKLKANATSKRERERERERGYENEEIGLIVKEYLLLKRLICSNEKKIRRM